VCNPRLSRQCSPFADYPRIHLIFPLPAARRDEIRNLVVSLGGEYSGKLDRTCTHLIVANNQTVKSPKVKWALAQQPTLYTSSVHQVEPPEDYVHVVWEGWFWDCVEFRARWGEERWDLRGGKGPDEVESEIEKRGEWMLSFAILK
jgi:hypothetical protein